MGASNVNPDGNDGMLCGPYLLIYSLSFSLSVIVLGSFFLLVQDLYSWFFFFIMIFRRSGFTMRMTLSLSVSFCYFEAGC